MNAEVIKKNYVDFQPKRKRVSKGEKYYYVTEDLEVSIHFDVNDNTDKSFYRSGNYFITKERAEKALAKLQQAIEEVHNDQTTCKKMMATKKQKALEGSKRLDITIRKCEDHNNTYYIECDKLGFLYNYRDPNMFGDEFTFRDINELLLIEQIDAFKKGETRFSVPVSNIRNMQNLKSDNDILAFKTKLQ